VSASPIDLVLARLDNPRPTGPDRWRCACPAHGGTNTSTLSIGVADNGAVLVKCWHGCDIDEIVRALGLELSDLFPPTPANGHGAPPLARRRLITPRQALEVLRFEAQLVWTAGHNLAAGHALTPDDLVRLDTAARRIHAVAIEVER
jgi:hypothetical protein